MTEENPIRVLLAEHFNYPVGKQADMGRYQMVWFDMLLVDRSQQLPTPPALRAAITVNTLP